MKRVALLLIIALLILTALAYNTLHSTKTLYVYTWSDYIKPEIIERFQREHDCWVVVDTYDSNEAMYTKLMLGASGYDIVFPSNYFLELMSRRGMLHELEADKVPNAKHIDTAFLEKRIGLPTTKYGAPYFMSFSGIAWRNDRLPSKPLSWNIFTTQKYKGRMTLLNDMRETIGVALRTLGYSANSTQSSEIQKAKELIIKEWRPNLAKFESEQYKNGIAGGEYLVVHGYSGDCLQVMNDNPAVTFSYPHEGSLVAVDYAAIMASSHQIDLAHQFINYLLDPSIAAENIQFTCARSPNLGARELLPGELARSSVLYPEDDPSIQFECIKPIDEAQAEYVKAWDDIKIGRL